MNQAPRNTTRLNTGNCSIKLAGTLVGSPRFDTREYTNTCFDRKFPFVRQVFFPMGLRNVHFIYTVVMKSTPKLNDGFAARPVAFKLCLIEHDEVDDTETALVCIEDVTCESPKTFTLNWSGRIGDPNKTYRLVFETNTCPPAMACLIRDYTNVLLFYIPCDIAENIPQVICP